MEPVGGYILADTRKMAWLQLQQSERALIRQDRIRHEGVRVRFRIKLAVAIEFGYNDPWSLPE